jgi:hypothetical protein
MPWHEESAPRAVREHVYQVTQGLGLDMLSVGPPMELVPAPGERLEIASVGKVYDLLVAALRRIPANPSGTASPTERTPGRSSGLVTT